MSSIRRFPTGATRDTEKDKIDYEGFTSPIVEQRFGEYMHQHRRQKDGKLREPDNWQKGFGDKHFDVCIKSLHRHFIDLRLAHRGFKSRHAIEESLCAIKFNSDAYLFKLLIEKNYGMEKSSKSKKLL